MPFQRTLEATLDLVELQKAIRAQENSFVRLTKLTGMIENRYPFNVLVFKRVYDNVLPFSKLFVVDVGGNADRNPEVFTWLTQYPGQIIVCQDQVYVSGSLMKIAVVGKPQ